jgi:hypothetical protein
MSGRYFFHLHKAQHVILDKKGVEVRHPDQIGAALLQALEEMQREKDLNISELEGWEVRVEDAAGNVVMTARLADIKSLGP